MMRRWALLVVVSLGCARTVTPQRAELAPAARGQWIDPQTEEWVRESDAPAVDLLQVQYASPPVAGPIISIDRRAIYSGDQAVFAWGEETKPFPVRWLPTLGSELLRLSTLWQAVNPGKQLWGGYLLNVEPDTPVTVLASVVHTAALFGFTYGQVLVRYRNAPTHLGVLGIDGRQSALGWKEMVESEHDVALSMGDASLVSVAWRQQHAHTGKRQVPARELATALTEVCRLLPRAGSDDEQNMTPAMIAAPANLTLNALVPILEAIDVPRRQYRSQTGRSFHSQTLVAVLSITPEDRERLRATWPEARHAAGVPDDDTGKP